MDYWKKVIVFLDWFLGCMKQKVGKKNKPKLVHGSLIVWGSLEERRNNFQNCTHRAIFFHVTSKKKKKNLAHALTVTSSANIILKVWLTNRAFFLKLEKFRIFSFFLLFDFCASWGQEKETGVSLLVWNFNTCLYLILYIRIQVFELSTWKLACSPTFPEGDYDVNSSFFLSDKYICGQEDARTPLQKLWSAVVWDKSWFGYQETWILALEICLNPDFWPQECH